mgnify:FL=1
MFKKISFGILVFFLIGCGFTPIYKKNIDNKFNIEIIKTSGEKEINRYIESDFQKYTDNKIQKKIKVSFNTGYSKIAVSKKSTGDIRAYKLIATTEFKIDNGTVEKIIYVTKKLNLNSSENLFEQKQYEDNIKRNIASLIVNDFIRQLAISNDN